MLKPNVPTKVAVLISSTTLTVAYVLFQGGAFGERAQPRLDRIKVASCLRQVGLAVAAYQEPTAGGYRWNGNPPTDLDMAALSCVGTVQVAAKNDYTVHVLPRNGLDFVPQLTLNFPATQPTTEP